MKDILYDFFKVTIFTFIMICTFLSYFILIPSIFLLKLVSVIIEINTNMLKKVYNLLEIY